MCTTNSVTFLGNAASVPQSNWGDADAVESYSASTDAALRVQCTDVVRIVVNSQNALCLIDSVSLTLTYTTSYVLPPPAPFGVQRQVVEYEVELLPRTVLGQTSAAPAQWVLQAADAPNEPTFAFAHTGGSGSVDDSLLLTGFELATGDDVAYVADASALQGVWPLPGDAVLVGAQLTYARNVAAAMSTAATDGNGNNVIVDVFDDPTLVGIGSDVNNLRALESVYSQCQGSTFVSWRESDLDTIAYGSLTTLQYPALSASDFNGACSVVARLGIAFSPLYLAEPMTVWIHSGRRAVVVVVVARVMKYSHIAIARVRLRLRYQSAPPVVAGAL